MKLKLLISLKVYINIRNCDIIIVTLYGYNVNIKLIQRKENYYVSYNGRSTQKI